MNRGVLKRVNSAADKSFDIFGTPPTKYPHAQPQESFNVFNTSPSQRYKESQSLARELKNAIAMDDDLFPPVYNYRMSWENNAAHLQPSYSGYHRGPLEQSVDPFFTQSTSLNENSPRNAAGESSILCAVSSKHSQQGKGVVKMTSDSIPKRRNYFEKWIKNKGETKSSTSNYLDDDFVEKSGSKTERNVLKPKQIRMDDYVFKARRVDKGSRHFGLRTTQQPKRGSRKKRSSIENMEIGGKPEGVRHSASPERKSSEQELDETIALGTPSPVRVPKRKMREDMGEQSCSALNTLKPVVKRQKSENIDGLEIPEKEIVLDETAPLLTSGLAKIEKSVKPVFSNTVGLATEHFASQKSLELVFNNVEKKTSIATSISSNNEEEGASNWNVSRPSLKIAENHRKEFGKKVSERELMVKQLLNSSFIKERDQVNEKLRDEARAELKDGEVIRNKNTRWNLMHGADCKCCRGYYDGLEMEQEEKRKFINKVSRHRYAHQALPDTPPRYWDLTLGPRDEEFTQDEKVDNVWSIRGENSRGKVRNWN